MGKQHKRGRCSRRQRSAEARRQCRAAHGIEPRELSTVRRSSGWSVPLLEEK